MKSPPRNSSNPTFSKALLTRNPPNSWTTPHLAPKNPSNACWTTPKSTSNTPSPKRRKSSTSRPWWTLKRLRLTSNAKSKKSLSKRPKNRPKGQETSPNSLTYKLTFMSHWYPYRQLRRSKCTSVRSRRGFWRTHVMRLLIRRMMCRVRLYPLSMSTLVTSVPKIINSDTGFIKLLRRSHQVSPFQTWFWHLPLWYSNWSSPRSKSSCRQHPYWLSVPVSRSSSNAPTRPSCTSHSLITTLW